MQHIDRGCASLNTRVMLEFDANGTVVVLIQKPSIFWCFVHAKDVINASVCVRLLSMIVNASLVSVFGGKAE